MVDDHPRADGFGPDLEPEDDVPGPRLVALSCDHPGEECGADVRCDVLARSFAEALPALIAYGRERGWSVTDDGRLAYCPAHWPVAPAALLGVPGAGVPGA